MSSVPFEQSKALCDLDNVRHGFFGRVGAADGAFNMSEKVGSTANLASNRATALEAIGAPNARFIQNTQVHGTRVVTIKPDNVDGAKQEADGLVTATPGIALSILTADCVPVLFADPDAGVIGACHAGWKGAVGNIMAETVQAMQALGAEPHNIVAAIGPAISMANYEVGPEFAENVRAIDATSDRFINIQPGTHREHFDVPGFVESKLQELGLKIAERVGSCTFADPKRYFSHRGTTQRGDAAGRQAALIALS